jgi:FtsZ-binding cell division protein ZapB
MKTNKITIATLLDEIEALKSELAHEREMNYDFQNEISDLGGQVEYLEQELDRVQYELRGNTRW